MRKSPLQKPATKVYHLTIERTRYYCFTVEAESEEQVREGWKANNYEYGAMHQPQYEWEEDERLTEVEEADEDPVNAEIDYDRVCSALGLPYSEEWDN